MDENQVVEALSALSQETRLRMVRYLVTKGIDCYQKYEYKCIVFCSQQLSLIQIKCCTQCFFIIVLQ